MGDVYRLPTTAKAAAFVRRAGQGERILITSRNRPMAELRPPLTVGPDDALLEEVARRLSEAAPGAEIVLFGPRDRQQGNGGSELDLVVIESDFDRRGRRLLVSGRHCVGWTRRSNWSSTEDGRPTSAVTSLAPSSTTP
jgi:antitoxin (DNA-binding transcriptional repressor) of toxin-antitoxin stability system